MERIKKLQLEALDTIGQQIAEFGHELDRLAKLTNEFDIEGKVFVLAERARRIEERALAIHRDIHVENSKLIGLGSKCSFCSAPMLDSCFVDAGNNAEQKIVVNCCDAHVREMDADSSAFEKKYAAIIDRFAAERTIS